MFSYKNTTYFDAGSFPSRPGCREEHKFFKNKISMVIVSIQMNRGKMNLPIYSVSACNTPICFVILSGKLAQY